MHSKRTAMALLAGTAVTAVLLTGCSTGTASKDASGTPASAKQTINMWGWTGAPGAAVVNKEISAFEKSYPNITVKYTEIAPADYTTKASLALSSGQSIDVLGIMPNVWAGENQQYFEPVKDWPNAKGLTSKYTASAIAQATGLFTDKVLRTIPDASSGSMLGIYNADILKKAGFTTPPTTWVQFKQLSDWLKANDPSVLPAVIADDGDNQEDLAVTIAGQTDPNWYNNVKYHGGSIDTPNYVAALNQIKALYANGTLDKRTLDLAYPDAAAAFDQGKAAVLWSGSWDAGRIVAAYRKTNKVAYSDAGVMGVPADDPANVSLRSFLDITYGIPAKSTHQAAAAKFIQWVTSGPGVDISAPLNVGEISAKKGFKLNPDVLSTPLEQQSYALLQQLVANPHSYRDNLSNLLHQIGSYIIPVINGQQTAQQTATQSEVDLKSGKYN
jgi:raffinose/stachyose/melibiose transport system substrate-binding protein